MCMRESWAALTALLAITGGLTGCGSEDDGRDGADPDAPGTPAASWTTTPAPQPGMTAPGKTLSIGSPITVPVQSFKDPVGGTAQITVLSIEAVSDQEADEAGFAGDDGTGDVFLIRSEARLTEVTDLRIFDPAVDLVPLADGELTTPLTPEDAELFACQGAAESSPEAGDRLEVCQAVGVADGKVVNEVRFSPYAGDYSLREGAPITWR